ncbi:MAG: hypothetical protein IKU67_04065 [Firmicutes bacterium]|nr:hypothetical protein [Bacillota bacterium]
MTNEVLKQFKYQEKEVKMWEKELKKIRDEKEREERMAGCLLNKYRAAGQAGKEHIRLLPEVEKEIEEIIEDRLEKLQKAKKDAIAYINEIEDSYMRQVVFMRIVLGMKWKQIASEMGGSNTEDSVRRAYSRFLRKKE